MKKLIYLFLILPALLPAQTTITSDQDFQGTYRILNLPDGSSAQEPMTVTQGMALLEGILEGFREIPFKANCLVAAQSNVNIASAPSSIDGVTLLSESRVLLYNQSDASENGVWQFNGVGNPLTRTQDFNSGGKAYNAVVGVLSGTDAGKLFHQVTTTGDIDVANLVFVEMN